MEVLFVLGVGLAAGTISGIVGFGWSIMLRFRFLMDALMLLSGLTMLWTAFR